MLPYIILALFSTTNLRTEGMEKLRNLPVFTHLFSDWHSQGSIECLPNQSCISKFSKEAMSLHSHCVCVCVFLTFAAYSIWFTRTGYHGSVKHCLFIVMYKKFANTLMCREILLLWHSPLVLLFNHIWYIISPLLPQ